MMMMMMMMILKDYAAFSLPFHTSRVCPFCRFLPFLAQKIKNAEEIASGDKKPPDYFAPDEEFPMSDEDEFEDVTVSVRFYGFLSCHVVETVRFPPSRVTFSFAPPDLQYNFRRRHGFASSHGNYPADKRLCSPCVTPTFRRLVSISRYRIVRDVM